MKRKIWVLVMALALLALLAVPASAAWSWQRLSNGALSIGNMLVASGDSYVSSEACAGSVTMQVSREGVFSGSSETCGGRKLYWMSPLCCPGWGCILIVWRIGSDTIDLDPYVNKYVRVTGFDDPSCEGFLNVTGIEVLLSPCPTWTWQRLSNNAGSSGWPAIAVSGSNVHVVWMDNTLGGNYEIFYKRSTNNGTTWSWQRLSNNAGTSDAPAIAVSGSIVHVVWMDNTLGGNYEIFYKRSTNNGTTWSWQRLSNNAGYSDWPAIAVSGSNVHVVWQDDTFGGNQEIFYKRSTDNGNTWSWQRLSNNAGFSGRPAIAVNGGNVHVVWEDNTLGGNGEIFYKRSTNGGASWTWQRLSNNGGISDDPAIAVSGNNVHVVWHDGSLGGNGEIFYKRSTNNGATWSWQRLTNNTGWSGFVAIAALGDNVHVVWDDQTFWSSGHDEVFHKGSRDKGALWAWQQLSNNWGYSESPDVAVNGSTVHVVWMDDTFGNYEIFYKRGN